MSAPILRGTYYNPSAMEALASSIDSLCKLREKLPDETTWVQSDIGKIASEIKSQSNDAGEVMRMLAETHAELMAFSKKHTAPK